MHGRLLLGTDRLRGLVFHGDDFVSVNDFDGELRDPAMAVQFRPDAVFLTDQQHARSELTGGLNRPLDLRSRGAIGTHGIQSNDAWHGGAGERLAGFFHFHYFATFVVTALGAGAMRHLLFVAVRTLGERVLRQRVVRAASGTTFLRVSPFWIRHGKFLFIGTPSKLGLVGIFNPSLSSSAGSFISRNLVDAALLSGSLPR
jgi:hypothetical protein